MAERERGIRVWIDDLREAPEGFIHIRNLEELKRLLESEDGPIALMSLDHDLGEGIPDGYELVKWLAREYPERWPRELRSHSANPVGRENIEAFDRGFRRAFFGREERR